MFPLSITTDYHGDRGCPQTRLQYAAEAGFTHLHWCHQWCTDFLYGAAEWNAIDSWLKEYHLTLLDIHGSAGQEKCWYSVEEYERQAGVQLVANRLEMLLRLRGEGYIIMHAPEIETQMSAEELATTEKQFEQCCRSLDELAPLFQRHGVRIALENYPTGTWKCLERFFARYPADFVGLTYDSGHGHIRKEHSLAKLEKNLDRLCAVHLHDNDGSSDQHQTPFYGTVDWPRLAKLLAKAPLLVGKPLQFEVVDYSTPFKIAEDQPETFRAFLTDCYEKCEKVAELVAND